MDWMRLRAAALLLSLGLAWHGPAGWQAALAADGESPEVKFARDHFRSGEKAFNAGDFAHALAEFEAGYALVPRPGFLLNMAHSQRRLGHSLKARSLYKRYLLADPESKQRDEVLGFIAQLDSIIADEERAEGGKPSVEAKPTAPAPAPPPAPATAQIRAAAITTPATPATPVLAAVHVTTAPRPASDPSSPTPIYRRGWFWAAAGAVVVGAAAALILSMRGSPTFHDDGSLGRLGQP
jgi:tetratricopeptide (TPR) repeat protein